MGRGEYSLPYMPQLDSLRAISVLAVIYTHYLPKDLWLLGIYWGGLGVRCFFVLSGFLITSILLQDLRHPFLPSYGSFLFRRIVRLYPAMLLMLLTGCVLDLAQFRESFAWHGLYLSNFYASALGAWPGPVGHLWTVAVEEQFYLLWPFVLFFTPARWFPPTLIAMAIFALCFRAGLGFAGVNEVAADALTPASFDALGAGALLALWRNHPRRIAYIAIAGLALTIPAKAAVLTLPLGKMQAWVAEDIAFTGAAMAFMWLTARAADGNAGRILNNAALRYIGAISYGIYLWHAPIHAFLAGAIPDRWLPAIAAGVSVGVASLSWHLIERPIRSAWRRYGIGADTAARLAASSSMSEARLRAENSALR